MWSTCRWMGDQQSFLLTCMFKNSLAHRVAQRFQVGSHVQLSTHCCSQVHLCSIVAGCSMQHDHQNGAWSKGAHSSARRCLRVHLCSTTAVLCWFAAWPPKWRACKRASVGCLGLRWCLSPKRARMSTPTLPRACASRCVIQSVWRQKVRHRHIHIYIYAMVSTGFLVLRWCLSPKRARMGTHTQNPTGMRFQVCDVCNILIGKELLDEVIALINLQIWNKVWHLYSALCCNR